MLQQAAARPAVVSRSGADVYLQVRPDGGAAWVSDPTIATAFPSMKDATRIATRLPSALRAFGLPLEVEVDAFRQLH